MVSASFCFSSIPSFRVVLLIACQCTCTPNTILHAIWDLVVVIVWQTALTPCTQQQQQQQRYVFPALMSPSHLFIAFASFASLVTTTVEPRLAPRKRFPGRFGSLFSRSGGLCQTPIRSFGRSNGKRPQPSIRSTPTRNVRVRVQLVSWPCYWGQSELELCAVVAPCHQDFSLNSVVARSIRTFPSKLHMPGVIAHDTQTNCICPVWVQPSCVPTMHTISARGAPPVAARRIHVANPKKANIAFGG